MATLPLSTQTLWHRHHLPAHTSFQGPCSVFLPPLPSPDPHQGCHLDCHSSPLLTSSLSPSSKPSTLFAKNKFQEGNSEGCFPTQKSSEAPRSPPSPGGRCKSTVPPVCAQSCDVFIPTKRYTQSLCFSVSVSGDTRPLSLFCLPNFSNM